MTRADARRAREGYCLPLGETRRQAIKRRLSRRRFIARINARYGAC